ncbi:hypothetical protein EVAR_101470_1 [Eumeta japonica]|uniref:Uncharacterized protein n=1 Tax=Eumeta variegata TaxID=151549 RepID=A0A4C1TUD1_EUMVA|nr:hypothetical protein EVAR_101470_1 [Eumeta japonica]
MLRDLHYNLCFAPSTTDNISLSANVTELSSNPGLYFEGVGSTKLVTATWKFTIYCDLTPIWKRNKVLKAGITAFSRFCKQSIANNSSEILYLEHQHTWHNLIQESDLLTVRRNRRTALDIRIMQNKWLKL